MWFHHTPTHAMHEADRKTEIRKREAQIRIQDSIHKQSLPKCRPKLHANNKMPKETIAGKLWYPGRVSPTSQPRPAPLNTQMQALKTLQENVRDLRPSNQTSTLDRSSGSQHVRPAFCTNRKLHLSSQCLVHLVPPCHFL